MLWTKCFNWDGHIIYLSNWDTSEKQKQEIPPLTELIFNYYLLYARHHKVLGSCGFYILEIEDTTKQLNKKERYQIIIKYLVENSNSNFGSGD